MKKEILKASRAILGISQEELAAKIGVSRVTYTKIENGSRAITREESTALSAVLGPTIQLILTGLKSANKQERNASR